MISKKYIILILISIFLIFELGIYQAKSIKINNISFEKPTFFRMKVHNIGSDKTMAFKVSEFFSFNNTFILKDSKSKLNSLLLVFTKFYTGDRISLLFNYSLNTEEHFNSLFNETNNILNFHNCLYTINKDISWKRDSFQIYGIIQNSNINFTLTANNESYFIDIRDKICK